MSHLPNETGPSLVTLPQLNAYLALEIGHVLSYPLDEAIVNHLAHKLRRRHLPIRKHLIQILQIEQGKDVGQDIGRLADVDHPIGAVDQFGRVELHVTRVRGPVHAAGRTEGRMVMKAVSNHERISDAEGEGQSLGGDDDGRQGERYKSSEKNAKGRYHAESGTAEKILICLCCFLSRLPVLTTEISEQSESESSRLLYSDRTKARQKILL